MESRINSETKRNKVIVQGNKPKIILCEQSKKVGGVSIDEGILLAKQYARKIIEITNMSSKKRKTVTSKTFLKEVNDKTKTVPLDDFEEQIKKW